MHPFYTHLKTSENRKVFLLFQGVEKGCIGNKWGNVNQGFIFSDAICLLHQDTISTVALLITHSSLHGIIIEIKTMFLYLVKCLWTRWSGLRANTLWDSQGEKAKKVEEVKKLCGWLSNFFLQLYLGLVRVTKLKTLLHQCNLKT